MLFLWHLAAGLWVDERPGAVDDVAMARYAFVAAAFILTPFVVWLLPFPGLGWTPDTVPATDSLMVEGEPYYGALPAMGTLYLAFRTGWHFLFWHAEYTGRLAGAPADTPE